MALIIREPPLPPRTIKSVASVTHGIKIIRQVCVFCNFDASMATAGFDVLFSLWSFFYENAAFSELTGVVLYPLP